MSACVWGVFSVCPNFLSHLHSWHSLPASCCLPGATLLFFMNLLLREAEDSVPDAKHCFFIKSKDVMRLVLELLLFDSPQMIEADRSQRICGLKKVKYW